MPLLHDSSPLAGVAILRTSRGDAVVAALPTIAYAGGAVANLRVAAIAGISCALVVGVFAIRRRPVAALGGLLAVVFAVLLALVTGQPKAFFLPGILLNGALAVGGFGSLFVRRPAVGYLLAPVWPRFTGWRGDIELRRIAAALTVVWSIVFALRFTVMGGCYFFDASPSALAVVKIVLGLPVAAVAAAISLRLATTTTREPVTSPAH